MTAKKICLLLLLTSFFCQSYSQTPDGRTVENIIALARLYGYIRYFHPSDEAAKINWEKFSQFGVDAVIDAKNDNDLLIRLRNLFYPIAPSLVLSSNDNPSVFDRKKLIPPDITGYKTIVWQYKGINLGNNNSAYTNVRTNRPDKQQASLSFAPFNQSLKGEGLAGKKIKLSGWMKVITENDNSGGHLWLRVDKEKGTGFFDNMAGRAATDTTWKKYEITGKIDDDAKNIYFGGFLSGAGQLYIDNIELMIEENGEWKSAQIKNGNFEDTKDNLPVDWNSTQNSSIYKYETSNETEFGKFCFKISSHTASDNPTPAQLIFNNYPVATEFVKKIISPKITAFIPISLYGNEFQTYPSADKSRFEELVKKINAISRQASGDMLNVRLADVIIAWNIFRHFFPYWEDTSKDAGTLLRETILKCFTDKTAIDFKYTLQLMTAALNDGHIRVSLSNDTSELYTAPLLLEYAENKLVVEKILDKKLESTIRKGDVITSINGIESENFIAEKEKYISGSPQWKRYRSKISMLAGTYNSTVELSNNGSQGIPIVRNFLVTGLYKEMTLRQKTGKIKEGIYYIDINAVPMDTINRLLPELENANAVIFDLRGYPKNNHEVINYLIKTSESDRWMFIPEIIYPDYQSVSFDSLGWNMKPKTPHFQGKIIFITDGSAISYAESYMGYIKDLHLATIIGQPTAGTNGNVNPFTLPGGYWISWTGMLVKNHDGSKHHLRGIIPDIFVNRTIQGIKEGKDEFFEKAIEFAEAEK